MGKYQAFSEYKYSNNEFLGKVPSHWVVGRFKFCTTRVVVGIAEAATHAYSDFGVPIIRSTNIKEKCLDTTRLLYIKDSFAEQNASKYLYENDIVTIRTGFPGISAVVPSSLDKSQCFTNLISTPKKSFEPKFLTYFLNSSSGKAYFELLGWGSAQKNISVPILQDFPLAHPLVDEQTQIANFLDHETAKIDTLIEKQQQLIKLLKEKRQAVISHAVTKGLPSVNGEAQAPMKDSGMEWLGEVPEHWVVSPIKHLLRQKKGAVKAGPFGSHLKNSDMDGGDVKVITQKNVIKKNLSIGDSFISEQKYRELSGFTIEKEDVLITTRGTIGRTCVYSDEAVAILHPCLIRMQCDETKVIPELLALIIQDSGYAMEQILVKSNATTIEVIYSDNLVNTEICVPKTIDEQVRLLEFVELETDKFDSLVRKAESAISLMQERRTALISAAVTGKIDVRNWQAPTPQVQALEQTA